VIIATAPIITMMTTSPRPDICITVKVTPASFPAVDGFASRVPEPSLEEYQVEIDKLRHAAEAIRMMCTDDVRAGLYFIRCFEFKEMLASCAEAQALRLLDQIRGSIRSSNVRVTDDYQVMAVEVLKVCHNIEEAKAHDVVSLLCLSITSPSSSSGCRRTILPGSP